MNKREHLSIVEYLYHMETRLENAVTDCTYRYIRRDLDSIDILEEIIAKERLKAFQEFSYDIIRILKLSEKE